MGGSREGFLDGDGCSARIEGEGEGGGGGRDEGERFLSAMETNIRSSMVGIVNIGARLPGTKSPASQLGCSRDPTVQKLERGHGGYNATRFWH